MQTRLPVDWPLPNSIVYGMNNRDTEGSGVASSDGALPGRQENSPTFRSGVLADIKGIDAQTYDYGTGSQYDA